MARYDVLGLGTVAVDELLHVPTYPAADAKVPILEVTWSLGGQVATALAAASRLGAACAYAGVLGSDALSARVREGLTTAGVALLVGFDQPDARPIHSRIVADRTTGTRAILYDKRALRPVPPAAVTADLLDTRVLLLDQLGPETAVAAAQLARSRGTAVVLDMEWAQAELVAEQMALADHLMVPRDFAAAVTGAADPATAAAQLHAAHPRACTAVTCGAAGCHYVAGRETTARHLPAFSVQTVETTGCGDVFHGAYAAALARGLGVPAALRFAAAAAARYAARPTGWQHLPDAAAIMEFLSQPQLTECPR